MTQSGKLPIFKFAVPEKKTTGGRNQKLWQGGADECTTGPYINVLRTFDREAYFLQKLI